MKRIPLTLTAAAAALAATFAFAAPGGGYGPGYGQGAGCPQAQDCPAGQGHGPGYGRAKGPGMGYGRGGGASGLGLMTDEERAEHRAKMHSFATVGECKAYFDEHRAQMAARAKERGIEPGPGPRMNPCDRMVNRGMLKPAG
jgi:hypothetical protein